MKLSLKNLLIIFGVLLIVFFTARLTKRDGRSKSLKSELVALDFVDVSKVEISGPKGIVMLTKADTTWTVSLPAGEKRTRKDAVKSTIEMLNTIKPDRLASRKKDKWRDYEVDSTGTRVKVFGGDKVLTDIVLGRFSVEGQRNFYSFVRLFEDENVYVANGFMKMSISETANDFRDNNVLSLKKDSLTQITFQYPEGTFSLNKEDAWFLGTDKADSVAVAGFLQGLNYTTSKEFREESIANYTHTVTFSFSNSPDIVLEGIRESDGPAIKSSENSLEIFGDEALWDKIFKEPGVFATTLE
ncbi:MAG: DUF4340 domain-containing protein [Cyclobacteriaceae bacterium]